MIHEDITEKILNCCFEVINTLGVGFLETVYKNALLIAMMDKGLKVMSDRGFEVAFRGRKIGVLEYKRMYYPTYPAACDRADPAMFLFKEKKTINYSQATPVACFLVINFVNAIHRSYIEPIFNHTPTCFQGMQKY